VAQLLGKCPECGSDMEKGYVITTSSLWWDAVVHAWGHGGERLTSFSMLGQNVEAYRCPKCKIVFFKYGQEPTST